MLIDKIPVRLPDDEIELEVQVAFRYSLFQ
jgi:hypothetical protein